MSCGFCHVGPNPIKPPADPENPKWENLSSNVGAQYFWVDRIFAWEADPSQLRLPAVPHLAAGHARHLAGLDRQHQQPAHDERGLRARRRGWTWPSAGARRRWPAANSNNKQFNDFVQPRAADAVLPAAGHGLDAARAEGRLRFGRRARRAQPRLPQHRPVQRGVAAALQRRWSAASRSRRSRSRVAQKNSAYWQATERRRRTWRCSS